MLSGSGTVSSSGTVSDPELLSDSSSTDDDSPSGSRVSCRMRHIRFRSPQMARLLLEPLSNAPVMTDAQRLN